MNERQNNTHADLIDALAADLNPTRAQARPLRLALPWLVGALLYTVFWVAVTGPFRPAFQTELLEPAFLGEMLIGLALAVGLAFLSLRTAVPGERARGLKWFCGIAFSAWLIALLAPLADPTYVEDMSGKRPHCIWEGLAIGTLPAGVLAALIARRFPLDSLPFVFGAGSAGLLPALTMQVACMHAPLHGLTFHVAPAIGTAIVIGLLAFYVNRARRSRSRAG